MIKEIKGFDGYFADSEGFIYSNKQTVFKKLKAYWNGGTETKHLRVNLYKDKKMIKRYVHQLILETFTEKPSDDLIVRHKNDIQSDNRLENLEWGTRELNSKDFFRNYKMYKAFYEKYKDVLDTN